MGDNKQIRSPEPVLSQEAAKKIAEAQIPKLETKYGLSLGDKMTGEIVNKAIQSTRGRGKTALMKALERLYEEKKNQPEAKQKAQTTKSEIIGESLDKGHRKAIEL